jgi:hypothetical protein
LCRAGNIHHLPPSFLRLCLFFFSSSSSFLLLQPIFIFYFTTSITNSFIMFALAAVTALLSLATSAFAQEGAPAAASVAQLVSQLRLAPGEADRFALLSDDDFIFDFINPPSNVGVTSGLGGHTVQAISDTFPAIIGQGVSMSALFFKSPRTRNVV